MRREGFASSPRRVPGWNPGSIPGEEREVVAHRLVFGTTALIAVAGGAFAISAFAAYAAGAGFGREPLVSAPGIVRTDPRLVRPASSSPDDLYLITQALARGQVEAMRRRQDRDPGDVRTRALLL